MKRRSFFSTLVLIFFLLAPPHAFSQECVILLHGLARTERSMQPLATYLDKQGFFIVNKGYPSTDKPIGELAASTIPLAVNSCKQKDKHPINFVTHSMGGILIRAYLKDHTIKDLGRTVMLSPPNKGSEIADTLRDYWFFRWWNGPAGQQLGTDNNSLPNLLGPANFTVAVITGDRSYNPLFSYIISGKDDGKVAVESAKLEGMDDFLVVHKSHTFLMRAKEVKQQITTYLKNGSFKR